MLIRVYIITCNYWEPFRYRAGGTTCTLIRTLRNEGTSINRTLLSVPNTLFVYITTLKSGHLTNRDTFIGFKLHYVGNTLIQTPLGQKKVSLLVRCPDFRGCIYKQGVWDRKRCPKVHCPFSGLILWSDRVEVCRKNEEVRLQHNAGHKGYAYTSKDVLCYDIYRHFLTPCKPRSSAYVQA